MDQYKERILRKKKRTTRTNYQQSQSTMELSESDIDADVDSDSEHDFSLDQPLEFDDQSLQSEMDSDDDDDLDLQNSEDSNDSDQEGSDVDKDDSDSDVSDSDDIVSLLILQFYLRHNLTWVALDDLLTLLNRIIKTKTAVVPRSKYLFQKILPKTEAPIYHYYCKKCMGYVGEKEQLLMWVVFLAVIWFQNSFSKEFLESSMKFGVRAPKNFTRKKSIFSSNGWLSHRSHKSKKYFFIK